MSSTNGSEPVEPTRPARRATPTSTDPEVLAAQIERTRESLAETVDAIAEKVSPKRVADRTRKKVAGAVATARGTVAEQAGLARDKASGAWDDVTGAAGAHAVGAAPEPTTFPVAPPAPPGTGPRPEVLAGGALGLVVLLLLRCRRNRRRAVATGAVAALAGAGADLRQEFVAARRKARRARRRHRR